MRKCPVLPESRGQPRGRELDKHQCRPHFPHICKHSDPRRHALRAPTVCLVLEAEDTKATAPGHSSHSVYMWGWGRIDRGYSTQAKWEHRRSRGHLTQPEGTAEGFLVEAMPTWSLGGQVGIS